MIGTETRMLLMMFHIVDILFLVWSMGDTFWPSLWSNLSVCLRSWGICMIEPIHLLWFIFLNQFSFSQDWLIDRTHSLALLYLLHQFDIILSECIQDVLQFDLPLHTQLLLFCNGYPRFHISTYSLHPFALLLSIDLHSIRNFHYYKNQNTI